MTLYQENIGRNEESVRNSQEYIDKNIDKREKATQKRLTIAIYVAAVIFIVLVFIGR